MRRTMLTRTSIAVAATLAAAALLLALWQVAVAPASESDPARQGERLFAAKGCRQCHVTDSREAGIGPGLEGLFDRETLPVSGRPATAANVRRQLVEPYAEMPSFADRLDAAERDRLIAYLQTL